MRAINHTSGSLKNILSSLKKSLSIRNSEEERSKIIDKLSNAIRDPNNVEDIIKNLDRLIDNKNKLDNNSQEYNDQPKKSIPLSRETSHKIQSYIEQYKVIHTSCLEKLKQLRNSFQETRESDSLGLESAKEKIKQCFQKEPITLKTIGLNFNDRSQIIQEITNFLDEYTEGRSSFSITEKIQEILQSPFININQDAYEYEEDFLNAIQVLSNAPTINALHQINKPLLFQEKNTLNLSNQHKNHSFAILPHNNDIAQNPELNNACSLAMKTLLARHLMPQTEKILILPNSANKDSDTEHTIESVNILLPRQKQGGAIEFDCFRLTYSPQAPHSWMLSVISNINSDQASQNFYISSQLISSSFSPKTFDVIPERNFLEKLTDALHSETAFIILSSLFEPDGQLNIDKVKPLQASVSKEDSLAQENSMKENIPIKILQEESLFIETSFEHAMNQLKLSSQTIDESQNQTQAVNNKDIAMTYKDFIDDADQLIQFLEREISLDESTETHDKASNQLLRFLKNEIIEINRNKETFDENDTHDPVINPLNLLIQKALNQHSQAQQLYEDSLNLVLTDDEVSSVHKLLNTTHNQNISELIKVSKDLYLLLNEEEECFNKKINEFEESHSKLSNHLKENRNNIPSSLLKKYMYTQEHFSQNIQKLSDKLERKENYSEIEGKIKAFNQLHFEFKNFINQFDEERQSQANLVHENSFNLLFPTNEIQSVRESMNKFYNQIMQLIKKLEIFPSLTNQGKELLSKLTDPKEAFLASHADLASFLKGDNDHISLSLLRMHIDKQKNIFQTIKSLSKEFLSPALLSKKLKEQKEALEKLLKQEAGKTDQPINEEALSKAIEKKDALSSYWTLHNDITVCEELHCQSTRSVKQLNKKERLEEAENKLRAIQEKYLKYTDHLTHNLKLNGAYQPMTNHKGALNQHPHYQQLINIADQLIQSKTKQPMPSRLVRFLNQIKRIFRSLLRIFKKTKEPSPGTRVSDNQQTLFAKQLHQAAQLIEEQNQDRDATTSTTPAA